MTIYTEQQGAEAMRRCNFHNGVTKDMKMVVVNERGEHLSKEDIKLLMKTLDDVLNEDKAKADALAADTIAASREARRQRNLKKMVKS